MLTVYNENEEQLSAPIAGGKAGLIKWFAETKNCKAADLMFTKRPRGYYITLFGQYRYTAIKA